MQVETAIFDEFLTAIKWFAAVLISVILQLIYVYVDLNVQKIAA